MKFGFLLLVGVALVGCGSSSADEAKAAQELAPKPASAEQKAQMDRIKAQFPQGGGAQPGHS